MVGLLQGNHDLYIEKDTSHMFKISLALIAIGGTGISIWRFTQMPELLKYLTYVIAILAIINAAPDAIEKLEQLNGKFGITEKISAVFHQVEQVASGGILRVERFAEEHRPQACASVVFSGDGGVGWSFGGSCPGTWLQARLSCNPFVCSTTTSTQTIAVIHCVASNVQSAMSGVGITSSEAESNAHAFAFQRGYSLDMCQRVAIIHPKQGRIG